MTRHLTLCATGALLLALAACGPATPSDPAPVVPPENVDAGPLPDTPADDDSQMPGTRGMTGTDTSAGHTGMTPASCNTISAEGFCGVRFGMSAESARSAFEGDLFGDVTSGTSCYYLRPDEDNYDRAIMVNEGEVQRVDIRDGSVTISGAGVGDTLDDVEARFETASRTPNKYLPDAEDLKVDLDNGQYAIFEGDESGNVTAYRVGIEPGVSFVEGCA